MELADQDAAELTTYIIRRRPVTRRVIHVIRYDQDESTELTTVVIRRRPTVRRVIVRRYDMDDTELKLKINAKVKIGKVQVGVKTDEEENTELATIINRRRPTVVIRRDEEDNTELRTVIIIRRKSDETGPYIELEGSDEDVELAKKMLGE